MPRSATTETWTTRRLLEWMTRHFESLSISSPRVLAEMLLAHVLGCERLRLYMEADRPASPGELARLRGLVKRASEHEPVQYLVGAASFFSHEFLVDNSTLIPQPCTEELVARVIEWCSQRRDAGELQVPQELEADGDPPPSLEEGAIVNGHRIADIGTGTGCVAVTLALQIPAARVVATDSSAEALDLARRNARKFGVEDRIDFRQGSLLEPLRDEVGAFDVICSNPPYITDREWESGEVEESVKRHVPASATRGGPDGLDFIRPLIAGAPALLRRPGRSGDGQEGASRRSLLAVEIGYQQREAVLDLAAKSRGLANAEVVKDLEGHWRLLLAERSGD